MASTLFPLIVLFCSLTAVSWATFSLHNHPSMRELLVDTLLTQYETHRSKDVIPDPVTVSAGMHVIRVESLQHRVLTMIVWTEMHWNDPRLAWHNDANGEAIHNISLPADQIWTPDLTGYTNDALPVPLVRKLEAIVDCYGNVTLFPAAKIRVFCVEHTVDDATGIHNCTFKIGSWVHDGNELDLQPQQNYVGTIDFVATEWDIEDSSVVRNELYYACCPGTPYVVLLHKLTLSHDHDE